MEDQLIKAELGLEKKQCPPGNQKVGGSNPTTATWWEKRKMDIGIAKDLSGRPADQS